MIQKVFLVNNRLGIHARAAARLVAVTSRFRCRIVLSRPDRNEEIDGKSILGILMMAASCGSGVIVRADGDDQEEAMAAIDRLFQEQFQEGRITE